MIGLRGLFLLCLCLLYQGSAQVIEFESHGLKYQTLTKSSITVMFASLPSRLREYSILQVAVSNGSAGPYVIKPEDFYYLKSDGEKLRGAPAGDVIAMLMRKGTANDVIKLVSLYENTLYGIPHMRSNNGYEQRRQAALTFGGSKMRAAITASALALPQVKLAPGETTDGAVFLPTDNKSLGPGHLEVRTNTDTFEFKVEE